MNEQDLIIEVVNYALKKGDQELWDILRVYLKENGNRYDSRYLHHWHKIMNGEDAEENEKV